MPSGHHRRREPKANSVWERRFIIGVLIERQSNLVATQNPRVWRFEVNKYISSALSKAQDPPVAISASGSQYRAEKRPFFTHGVIEAGPARK